MNLPPSKVVGEHLLDDVGRSVRDCLEFLKLCILLY